MTVMRLVLFVSIVAFQFWSTAASLAFDDGATEPPVQPTLPIGQPEEPKVTSDPEEDEDLPRVDEYQVLTDSQRRLSEIYQIGASELRIFRDGEPLRDQELTSLSKLLFRLPTIPAGDVDGWAQSATDWSEIEQDPWRHRANVFNVQGYVKNATKIAVPAELVDQLAFDELYRCELELVGSDRRAIIFCRHIPKSWKLDAPLNEFAAANGWFLKTGKLRGDRHDLVLAADRVKWHPDTATEGMNLNPGHLLLARFGMDIGLWDYVSNGQGIGEWFKIKNGREKVRVASRSVSRETFTDMLSAEREAFYQMLTAASDIPVKQLKAAARDELKLRGQERISIVPLFNEPQTQHARAITLKGVARRVTKVVVGSSSDFPGQASDVKERFGLDHYYEIHFFTGDSQNEPLIFIAKHLPPNLPRGQKVRAPVQVTGFYFKKYAYPAMIPNKETSQSELIKRESPLMVGGLVEFIPP
ncbi:MAG: hypothetical protein MI757_21690, partial [Pirellulales bacterium]|nr:hypothetical protein [Pirellulales bacterium]